MAIRNAAEFEVIMATVLAKIERLLDEQPRNESLASAKRAFGVLQSALKKGVKLNAVEMKALVGASETLDRAGKGDPDLGDKLYDFMDYVEDNHAAPQN